MSTNAKFGGAAAKCQACQKTVYPLEAVNLPDAVFHKRCFKCAKCDCVVSPGSCAMFKQIPYCKVHFLEMFKERGTYAVFSDDYDPNAPAFKSRSALQSQVSASSANSDAPATRSGHRSQNSASSDSDDAPIVTMSAPATVVKSSDEAGDKLLPPAGAVAARLAKFNSSDASLASQPTPQPKQEAAPTTTADPTKEDDEPGAGVGLFPSSDGINFRVFSSIMKNDPLELREAVAEIGLAALFDKNENGSTPIELAFTSDKLECGRALIDVVQEQIVKFRAS